MKGSLGVYSYNEAHVGKQATGFYFVLSSCPEITELKIPSFLETAKSIEILWNMEICKHGGGFAALRHSKLGKH